MQNVFSILTPPPKTTTPQQAHLKKIEHEIESAHYKSTFIIINSQFTDVSSNQYLYSVSHEIRKMEMCLTAHIIIFIHKKYGHSFKCKE